MQVAFGGGMSCGEAVRVVLSKIWDLVAILLMKSGLWGIWGIMSGMRLCLRRLYFPTLFSCRGTLVTQCVLT